jgi:hypothetical protein
MYPRRAYRRRGGTRGIGGAASATTRRERREARNHALRVGQPHHGRRKCGTSIELWSAGIGVGTATRFLILLGDRDQGFERERLAQDNGGGERGAQKCEGEERLEEHAIL